MRSSFLFLLLLYMALATVIHIFSMPVPINQAYAKTAAKTVKMETTVTGPEQATELWQGKVLSASFRAGMCFAPDGKARGVLLLKHANGQEDVYHLYGTMKDNIFNLSHSSGHVFSGSLADPGHMEGKVKLKNGPKLTLKGKRIMNAPLLASDCAPLPE